MTVYAAGAVLWREEGDGLKVALIHRARYDDWSWPKGKVDPGEVLPQTAVREIREETGLRVKLGIRLDIVKYTLPSGAPKEVHYWAARVTDKSLRKSTFKPSEEVASVEWRTPAQARELLTYDFDRDILQRVEDLYTLGKLKTKPVVIQRHAQALPRNEWKNGKNIDDGARPLTPLGAKQAMALIPLLKAFGVKRVYSSPWVRCANTVKPFARNQKLPIIERHQVSELGNKKGPRRTANVVDDIVKSGLPSVLCSHRPALPTILDTLSKYGNANQEILLHEGRALEPGEMMVVHLTAKKADAVRSIVAIETYAPLVTIE